MTVWEPGFVHSNIHIKEPPKGTIETEKAVKDALARLGKDKLTEGSLQFKLTPAIPSNWLGARFAKKIRDGH